MPKKGNAKKCSNYHTIALISHTSKVMLKFPKPGFNSTWTVNFQMFKLNLQKPEQPRSNFQHPLHHWKSKRIPEKHLFLLYWLCQSLWLFGSQQTVENSSSRIATGISWSSLGGLKGVKPPEAFGERPRDWSLGHVRHQCMISHMISAWSVTW